MSIRTLVEINHDMTHRMEDLLPVLTRYLCSGSAEDAERLERFGFNVIGQRHHSAAYHLREEPDGFPPVYSKPRQVRDRSKR